MQAHNSAPEYFTTPLGKMVLGDSSQILNDYLAPASVDLIITSPPFALVSKKAYGNVYADKYVEWFRPFGELFRRLLKPEGSLVIDIGGTWTAGHPTRSLYQYDLLIMLVRECGFHLAEEFFWWNPAKLPTPAEWVTIRRIRVKDAIDFVWWLSPTPWPKASNRRVPAPYSDAMRSRLGKDSGIATRPSGHRIDARSWVDNNTAIPSNLLAIPHTESSSTYLRYCRTHGIAPHPARFPSELPEFFVRMLTDRGDIVVDPFAGSCVTGEVAERLERRWICVEMVEEYLRAAVGRFSQPGSDAIPPKSYAGRAYRAHHPGAAWEDVDTENLSTDGGRTRVAKVKETPAECVPSTTCTRASRYRQRTRPRDHRDHLAVRADHGLAVTRETTKLAK